MLNEPDEVDALKTDMVGPPPPPVEAIVIEPDELVIEMPVPAVRVARL